MSIIAFRLADRGFNEPVRQIRKTKAVPNPVSGSGDCSFDGGSRKKKRQSVVNFAPSCCKPRKPQSFPSATQLDHPPPIPSPSSIHQPSQQPPQEAKEEFSPSFSYNFCLWIVCRAFKGQSCLLLLFVAYPALCPAALSAFSICPTNQHPSSVASLLYHHYCPTDLTLLCRYRQKNCNLLSPLTGIHPQPHYLKTSTNPPSTNTTPRLE
ncbi:hypothetical protein FPQ18DRAFT_51931 [Pyronema domesticum]|nr:hypothetical protein FPQ18DRAFT_51931 [Pyronema domesticum]